MRKPTKDSALWLAGMGYCIFPVEEDGKMPVIPWKENSTCSLRVVREWWDEFPNDNIGIDCGRSGLLVVDVDSEHADDAFVTLAKEHGSDLDDVPTVDTRRGSHYYWSQPEQPLGNTASKLYPGIDTRGRGGMVLGPGSVVSGFTYELSWGDLDFVPELPSWLEKMLRPKPRRISISDRQRRGRLKRWPKLAQAELEKHVRRIEYSPDGQQNSRIYQAAFFLTLECCPPLELPEIAEALEAAAERGNHPMHRARPTIESGISAALAELEGEKR